MDALFPQDFRSPCPVASALDVIGDRWTLVLIRDLVLGASRYNDFLTSPEGIPSNLLADRLKTMEANGIVAKEPYQTRPLRYAYQLTAKGQALVPVMRALLRWGMEWLPDRHTRLPEEVPWVRRVRGLG